MVAVDRTPRAEPGHNVALRALAVAETRPQGPTGRVEAGKGPGLPRDETQTFTLTGPQPLK
jgi:hypothetical protein